MTRRQLISSALGLGAAALLGLKPKATPAFEAKKFAALDVRCEEIIEPREWIPIQLSDQVIEDIWLQLKVVPVFQRMYLS